MIRANSILNRLPFLPFALIFISSHVHSAVYSDRSDCIALLLNRSAEEQFLLSFKMSLTAVQETASLSHSNGGGVYKIIDQDNRTYVVRFGGQLKHNIQFENFASYIVLNSPTVLTPFAKKLPYSESLQNVLDEALSKHKEFRPGKEISVAAYLPLKTGFQYLRKNSGLRFLEKLLELKEALPDKKVSRLKQWAKRFIKEAPNPLKAELDLWKKETLASRIAIAQNLKALYPTLLEKFDQTREADLIFEAFRKAFLKMTKAEAKPLDNLELMTFDQLPESLRSQIADMWALDMVLGIHDLHDHNWLIDDHNPNDLRVVRIDLAFSTPQFQNGITSLNNWTKQSPLYQGDISPELQSKLGKNISSAMREYLASLDPHEIKARANYVTFQITDIEIEGMHKRARAVLDLK